MKPFNLECAIAGDPVITRDGRAVIDIHHFKHDKSNLCLCAHIEGEPSPDWFLASGRDNLSEEDPNDLFMAPKKRTVYMNVMEGGPGAWFISAYAANAAEHTYSVIARAVPIEIEL